MLNSLLLRFLNTSLGVSLCMRPLRRLSRPGVSAAARRCCSARIACGVVGAPRLFGKGLPNPLTLGVRV